MNVQKFEGLVAAPFAPMNMDGDVMYDAIPDYLKFLEKNRIAGVFVNGSTGEGVSLTVSERLRMTEAWVRAAKESTLKVITLVGGTSYRESQELAIHARDIGTDAIALMAPFYFKLPDAGTLVEFCARVAETVPELPVYFYHIPVLTGCYTPMIDFLARADKVIPNLAGIKYTHEDFMDFLSCMHFNDGKYDMLWGRDENLLSALVLGARAGVGSTFNYAAPLYHEIIRSFDSSDLPRARWLQQKSIDMIRLLGKYGGISTGKAYMRYLGFDYGGFRLPLKNMSEDNFSSFVRDVDMLGMDEYFSVK